MRIKQIIGLLGSVTLFIGVFAPFVTIQAIGNVSYFLCSKKSDSIIILVLATTSFILALEKKFKALWFTGFISLGMTIAAFINFKIFTPDIQLQWGWILFVIGPALIIISAAIKENKEEKNNE